MVYMYSYTNILLWVLYECLPRTLRTPLNTPYTPNTSNELNTSNHSGFPLRLKKLILMRRNARGGKRIETLELLRGLYESNARIIGMDGMLELLRGL